MAGQPQIGTIIDGKYRLERVLGQGGMGLVMAARHVRLGHLVAIKFPIREDFATGNMVERLLREARAVMRLKSDHVARVFDIGVHDQTHPYIVMEYLRGSDLGALLRTGPLSLEHAVEYVLQASEALAEAHARGIIHRDIKPSNLLLTERANGTPWLKVIDFGLVKSPDEDETGTLTRSGATLGSPQFMAPEQMRGASQVDARADIWALGATLYTLLAAVPPFPGNDVLAVHDSIRAGRRRLEGSGPETEALDSVIDRCLQISPDSRFATIAELVEHLVKISPVQLGDRASAVHRIVQSAIEAHTNEQDVVGQAPNDVNSTLPPLDPSWNGADQTTDEAAARSIRVRRVRVAASLLGFAALLVLGLLWLQRRAPLAQAPTALIATSRSQRSSPQTAPDTPRGERSLPPISASSQSPPIVASARALRLSQTPRPSAPRPSVTITSTAPNLDPLADPN